MNPKVAVRSREGHEHVEHYAAKDPHTVEIKLKDSFAPYLVSWQKTSIIPKHILSTVPDINIAPFNTSQSARVRSSSRIGSLAATSRSSPIRNITAARRS